MIFEDKSSVFDTFLGNWTNNKLSAGGKHLSAKKFPAVQLSGLQSTPFSKVSLRRSQSHATKSIQSFLPPFRRMVFQGYPFRSILILILTKKDYARIRVRSVCVYDTNVA